MKALILKRPGSIVSMQVQEIETPEPQAGEVRVRLLAASLNPLDYKLVLAGHPAWKYPHVPGQDGCGVVEACGAGQEGWLGKSVLFLSDPLADGCFAQSIVVPADSLVPLPDGLDPLDAASLPCAGLTAWDCLVQRAHLSAGQDVLVQGAAGGVGSFAVQIAKRLGARVIATASPANADYLAGLGADHVVDYNAEPVRDRVMEITGGSGVHALIDTIGASSATQNLACLGYQGHLLCLSGLPDLSRHPLPAAAPSIHDIATGAVFAQGRPADRERQRGQLAELAGLLASGAIRPVRQKTVSLSAVPAAMEELRDRHVRGKIVVDFGLPFDCVET